MKTKQTIAVIGASGNMGSAISKSLSKGNYRLLLCSDDKGKVQTTLNDIKASNPTSDVEVIDCSAQASWEADIIIAAVPYQAEKDIAEKIKEVANYCCPTNVQNNRIYRLYGLLLIHHKYNL